MTDREAFDGRERHTARQLTTLWHARWGSRATERAQANCAWTVHNREQSQEEQQMGVPTEKVASSIETIEDELNYIEDQTTDAPHNIYEADLDQLFALGHRAIQLTISIHVQQKESTI